jgi:hypothetical protein
MPKEPGATRRSGCEANVTWVFHNFCSGILGLAELIEAQFWGLHNYKVHGLNELFTKQTHPPSIKSFRTLHFSANVTGPEFSRIAPFSFTRNTEGRK